MFQEPAKQVLVTYAKYIFLDGCQFFWAVDLPEENLASTGRI